jgi:peptidoglycan/LPS O-acetylase OafA/YrhL
MGRGRFPGLDGLRFFAALGVAITHVEQAAWLLGVANVYLFKLISNLGDTCVSLFFVLSGFLITSLLLSELERTYSIQLFNFYGRRALRIWPVYFTLIAIGFFVLPNLSIMQVPGYQPAGTTKWWESFWLYMIFAPHVAETWLPGIPYAGVLWSLGVEEWFYFGWPLILRKGVRSTILLASGIAIAWGITRWLPYHFAALMNMLRFECLAVGALFAALASYATAKPILTNLISILHSRQAQLVILAMLPFTLAMQDHLLQSLVFGGLIFNLSTNPRSLLRFDAPVYRHLGAISYSMYAFNWIAAVIAARVVGLMISPRWLGGVADFLAGIALTLLFAHLSYYVIERPFLDLRRYFQRVVPALPS